MEIREYHTEWKEILLVQGVGALTRRLVVGEQKKGSLSVEKPLSKVIQITDSVTNPMVYHQVQQLSFLDSPAARKTSYDTEEEASNLFRHATSKISLKAFNVIN